MKVLLISHNPLCTTNNMGKTLLSLFSSFAKDELCQLYIYPSIPDVDLCHAYYRVTDKEILRSLVSFQAPGGELDKSKISPTASQFENPEDQEIYRKPGNHSALKRLLRDTMWRLSRWNTAALQAWLDKEAPTCIFLAPGYAKFIYDIALAIAEKRQLPIVTYICDDYYFVKTPDGFLAKQQLRLLKKKTDELMAKTTHLIGICDEISQGYEAHFGVPATTVMTGASVPIAVADDVTKAPTQLAYFGNIGCNRFTSLVHIGQALDRLNAERGTDYVLTVYTGETRSDMLAAFDGIRSIRFGGFLSGEAYRNAFDAADVLFHVEAFDDDSIDLVKHSVSTKIADSLAGGKPLFAYGPREIASMQHVIRHNCAITASSVEELDEALRRVLFDAQARAGAVRNALNTAAVCHDSAANSRVLRSIME